MLAGKGVGVTTGEALVVVIVVVVVVAGGEMISVAGSDLGSASTQYLRAIGQSVS